MSDRGIVHIADILLLPAEPDLAPWLGLLIAGSSVILLGLVFHRTKHWRRIGRLKRQLRLGQLSNRAACDRIAAQIHRGSITIDPTHLETLSRLRFQKESPATTEVLVLLDQVNPSD